MKNKRKFKFFKISSTILILIALIFVRYFYVKSLIVKDIEGQIITQKINVYSPIHSQIEKIYVKENDIIKKGDLLLSYNVNLLKARLDLLKTKFEFVKNEKNLAKFYEEKALEEYINIKKKTEIDKAEIQKKLKILEEKQLVYNIYDSKEALYKSQITFLKEEIKKRKLFSSFSGKLSQIIVSENKEVKQNELLFKISDDKNVLIKANIEKKYLSRFLKNENFKISLKDKPNIKFQGFIYNVSKENNDVLFRVNQIKNNYDEKNISLNEGMIANIEYE